MNSDESYAACVDDNGIVQKVIVIPPMDNDDALITAYCNGIGLAGTWIDTSPTGSRRGKFAGIGDQYDEIFDEFVSPEFPTQELPD